MASLNAPPTRRVEDRTSDPRSGQPTGPQPQLERVAHPAFTRTAPMIRPAAAPVQPDLPQPAVLPQPQLIPNCWPWTQSASSGSCSGRAGQLQGATRPPSTISARGCPATVFPEGLSGPAIGQLQRQLQVDATLTDTPGQDLLGAPYPVPHRVARRNAPRARRAGPARARELQGTGGGLHHMGVDRLLHQVEPAFETFASRWRAAG
jgi:hypothetical protein